MSYTPPGVSTQTLAPGTHQVWLTDLKQITQADRLQKFNAQAVFVATYKSVESAIEIDQIIKFNGSRADFYAGQTIDRLHLAAGLPEPQPGEPLDLDNLKALLDGIELQLVVNDKGYANEIYVPLGATSEDTI
jgi:hypothetical protein